MKKVPQETVSVRQLRSDWLRIKRRIARGQRFILTDNGKPIMQLAPLEHSDAQEIDYKEHWAKQLERVKAIMHGRSTGASIVVEERATTKW